MEQQHETVTITLSGRIDSGNAAEIEKQIFAKLAGKEHAPVILDAGNLAYISSAGLSAVFCST